MKIIQTIICILVAMVVINCSPISLENYKHYKGESRPLSEVGIVKGYDSYRTGKGLNSLLLIKSINGKEIASMGAESVELVPGTYNIGLTYVVGSDMVDYYHYGFITIHVEKEKTYLLRVKANFKTNKIRYYYDAFPTKSVNKAET